MVCGLRGSVSLRCILANVAFAFACRLKMRLLSALMTGLVLEITIMLVMIAPATTMQRRSFTLWLSFPFGPLSRRILIWLSWFIRAQSHITFPYGDITCLVIIPNTYIIIHCLYILVENTMHMQPLRSRAWKWVEHKRNTKMTKDQQDDQLTSQFLGRQTHTMTTSRIWKRRWSMTNKKPGKMC